MQVPHTMNSLFETFDLQGMALRNRIVMAPLTRSRARHDIADERIALYYTQRATAGLIVSEGTPISREGQGYLFNPGIFSAEQIAGWRLTTQSVHSVGGKIFAQIWHVGRVSHPSIFQDRQLPVSGSSKRAVGAAAFGYDDKGKHGFVEPPAPSQLETSEIGRVVEEFAQAAQNAIEAGFDGVEIHGANGYLLEQFMKDGANHRTDAYGGSIENRARLLLEVTAAVVLQIGADRTGVRISPVSPANGIACSDPQPQYDYITEQLSALGVVYLHVVEGATGGPRDVAPFDY